MSLRSVERIDGLPPKKDGAFSMWAKPVEVPRLIRLREEVMRVFGGAPPLTGNIVIRLEVHVGPSNTRATGDLDNFITGICDGLMAADPRANLDPAWETLPQIHPSKAIAFVDDADVVSISAVKIVRDEAPWYSLDLDVEEADYGSPRRQVP